MTQLEQTVYRLIMALYLTRENPIIDEALDDIDFFEPGSSVYFEGDDIMISADNGIINLSELINQK